MVESTIHRPSYHLMLFHVNFNGLYAQLHYFLNLSQLLVSCLSLLAKLINSGVLDLSSHDNNNNTHLN